MGKSSRNATFFISKNIFIVQAIFYDTQHIFLLSNTKKEGVVYENRIYQKW